MDRDYAQRLAARIAGLIDGLIATRIELLTLAAESSSVQRTLLGLFSAPLTGDAPQRLEPYAQLCPSVLLGFEKGGQVDLTVTPKRDQTLSPADCLNVLRIQFSGKSRWLTLEADMVWSELAVAERFQLTLVAEPDRPVNCRAEVRFQKKGGGFLNHTFAVFDLQPGLKSASAAGEFALPDLSDIETAQPPRLLIFFDSERDLRLDINYINLYFA